MFQDRAKRCFVLIVTRTGDKDAVREWRSELAKLECETEVITPDEIWDHLKKKEQIDGLMLDDVHPPDTPEMGVLALVLTHARPEPRVAFLVAAHDDYHDLQHRVDGKAIVHHDGDGMMDKVFEHLAGTIKGEVPADLRH